MGEVNRRLVRPPFKRIGITPFPNWGESMARTVARSLQVALATGAAIVALIAAPATAQARANIRVPSQSLEQSLKQVAAQSRTNILFTPDAVAGLRGRSVDGVMTAEGAVRKLVAGTALEVVSDGNGGLIVRRRGAAKRTPAMTGGSRFAPASAVPAASAEAEPSDGDVIIVTANKREEDVRKVAGSVTAVTGKQLDEQGAQSYADYLTKLPGVQFNAAIPGYSSISIRGVSSTTSIDVGQGTTGIYINEVPLTEPFNSAGIPDVDTFDVDRVEVLRGPQGTLFGSATLGGAINYVAARARLDRVEGRVEAGASITDSSDDLSWSGKAMINLPIVTDKLAVRAVGTFRRSAGYLDNIGVSKKDSNAMDSYGGRVSVEWQPVEGVDISALSLYFKGKYDDAFVALPGLGDLKRNTVMLEPFRSTAEVHSLRGDFDLGFATLTVNGAHMVKKTRNVTDFTLNFRGLFGNIPTQIPLIAERRANGDLIEARLTSESGGDFEWLVGASHNNIKIALPSYSEFDGAAALVETLYAGRFGAGVGALAAPGGRFTDYNLRVNGTEKALFGEATWRFAPALKLAAGGRYFDTKVKNQSRQTGLLNLLSTGGQLVSAPAPVTQQADGFNPKVSLTFEPNDDLLVYGLVSKGFRFGGPNAIPTNPLFPSPADFGSDKLVNYELGLRASSPDKNFLLDATVYYIDWKDIQLLIVRGDNLAYADNVGRARNIGADVALTWRPSRAITLNSTLGYLDAELRDNVRAGGVNVPAGARLPGASRWRVSNSVTWRGASDLEPMAILSHRYVSEAPSNLAGTLTQGGYSIFDLRGSVRYHGARVEAFVENIGNKRGVTVQETGRAGLREYYVRPRTAGVRLTYDF